MGLKLVTYMQNTSMGKTILLTSLPSIYSKAITFSAINQHFKFYCISTIWKKSFQFDCGLWAMYNKYFIYVKRQK